MSGYELVLVTCPESDVERIARTLVEERLAACGNAIRGVRSIYRWKGEVDEATEALLVLKTRTELSDRLQARVVELHPYECPEVLRVGVNGGLPAYLAWIAEST